MTYPGVADLRWELSASTGMSEPKGRGDHEGTKILEP